eukprot:TRINITY_DN3096_c0_g2_i1.p1 TRINITY_DN3096_c0_g2~~TRINITY_DN3096_c0_g2_i1.p1  ORF type:complete len:406 (+),score=138.58 TRINITY_DN3096_c0_g2_i1:107-1324(+)
MRETVEAAFAASKASLAVDRRRQQRCRSVAAPSCLVVAPLLLGAWLLCSAGSLGNLRGSPRAFVNAGGAASSFNNRLLLERYALVARQATAAASGDGVSVDSSGDGSSSGEAVTPSGKTPKTTKSAKSFESMLAAADEFTAKKDRKKRSQPKTGQITVSLEDDLQGLSLVDDEDFSDSMEMAARRTPKMDVTLLGRFRAWASETWQLITNPTQMQVDFIVTFVAIFAFIMILFVLTYSAGGIKLRGQVNFEEKQMEQAQLPYYQRWQMAQVRRERFMAVDDISSLEYDEEDAMCYSGLIDKICIDSTDEKNPKSVPGNYVDEKLPRVPLDAPEAKYDDAGAFKLKPGQMPGTGGGAVNTPQMKMPGGVMDAPGPGGAAGGGGGAAGEVPEEVKGFSGKVKVNKEE